MLVVDRLSAVMMTLGAIVALADARLFGRALGPPGQPFHSLFQFLMMGLNGAFLTGDLFNLFVFFEILLAASYGLLLRGGGAPRVKLSLHYIVVNLDGVVPVPDRRRVDLRHGRHAQHGGSRGPAAALAPDDRALLDAGAAILGIAFLVKAGSWPLNFWLPGAYSVALAPVAAVFRHDDQGRRLCRAAPRHADAGVRDARAAPCSTSGSRPWSPARSACSRRSISRDSVAYSVLVSMGILLATPGPAHRSAHGAGAVLSDRIGADDLHVFHADRDDRPHARDAIPPASPEDRSAKKPSPSTSPTASRSPRSTRAARMSASRFPPPWRSSAWCSCAACCS